MKSIKNLLQGEITKQPLLICLTSAIAFPAAAQSSLRLAGIMDSAVRHVSNSGAGSATSLVSGSNATSRIIISGREDLGGGLSAGFHLEHGLLADTGSLANTSKMWDRRSTVSLVDSRLGEVRLGRDVVPSYVSWTRYDPFNYIGIGRTANLISAGAAAAPNPIRSAFSTNGNTLVRSDNAVQYFLPANLGGLEGQVMVAPGEGGDAVAGQAKLAGVRLAYAGSGYGVSAATTQSKNNLTTAGWFRDTIVGGNYAVSNVMLTAAWRKFAYAESRQVLWLFGATASFGAHEVKGSVVRSDMSGRVGTTSINANDSNQYAVGYVYNLSKRTAVYTHAARIANSGAARYTLDAPAVNSGGIRSTGYELGIRHRF